MIEIEPTDEKISVCSCCGQKTKSIAGFAHSDQGTLASYVFQWTINQSIEDHSANFDLIYGKWGEGAGPQDKVAISLIHFTVNGIPGVSIIDATDRPNANSQLIGSAKQRDDVVGTPLAKKVFAIFDAVMAQDYRTH